MHDPRKDIFLFDRDLITTLSATEIPVFASRVYPEIPNCVAYPIMDIMKEFKVGFFLNVVAYAIAYAITLNPKKISLYGADMRPDSGIEHHREEKGCVEFWLGVATGRGIEHYTPAQSFLLRRTMLGNFYGFEAREGANGLIQYIPENMRKIHKNYKLTPIDEDGNELEEESSMLNLRTTEDRLREADARTQSQDGSVATESISIADLSGKVEKDDIRDMQFVPE